MIPPPDDRQLLQAYVENRSETAFVELVRRHIDFVYSIALRQLAGDAHLAQDVAQEVFVALAHQAPSLSQRPALEGWLYCTSRYTAIDVARSETRRRAREEKAASMHEFSPEPTPAIDTQHLRPLLDEAIAGLRDNDRDAVVLRFFKNRSYAEVAAHLRLTENTARMRVERALEKLQAALSRQGITSTTAALGVCLASQPLLAAPAGLIASVSGAALASGSVATSTALFMGMTKLQIGIACGLAAAATVGLVLEHRSTAEAASALAQQRQEQRAAERAHYQAREAEAAHVAAQAQELARLREEAHVLRAESAVIAQRRRAPSVAVAPIPQLTFTGPYLEPRQVDRQPRPAQQVLPLYPSELRRLGIQGSATVDVIVDAEGNVHNARVLDATHPALGESAVEAVKRWRYEPAQKDGLPVAMHLKIPVHYKLGENSPATTAAESAASSPAKKPAPFIPWF